MKFIIVALLFISLAAFAQTEHIVIKPVGLGDKVQRPIIISNNAVDTNLFDETSNFGLDSNGKVILYENAYYLYVFDASTYRATVDALMIKGSPNKATNEYALTGRFEIIVYRGKDTLDFKRCLNSNQSKKFLESVLSNSKLKSALNSPQKYFLRAPTFKSIYTEHVPSSLFVLLEKYYCIINQKQYPCYKQ